MSELVQGMHDLLGILLALGIVGPPGRAAVIRVLAPAAPIDAHSAVPEQRE